MPMKPYMNRLEISLRQQAHARKRKERTNTAVKTMQLTLAFACIYIILDSNFNQWLYERLLYKPNFSTINNVFLTFEKGSGAFERTGPGNDMYVATKEKQRNYASLSEYITDSGEQADLSMNDSEIRKFFMRVANESIYIYSAIVHQYSSMVRRYKPIRLRNYPGGDYSEVILLNGWRHNNSNPNLKCCYMLENRKVLSHNRFLEQYVHDGFSSSLNPVQYRCPCIHHNSKEIIGIGLSNKETLCPTSTEYYLSPFKITRRKDVSIGVCTKISYGSIKPTRLVEWFEALKLLGVDKILSYNANLTTEAQMVFDQYHSIGFLEYFPFEVPEKDKYPREMGDKLKQAWADEQVVINDCHERLRAFKYAVFLDKDEILLPKMFQLKDALKIYFEMLDDNVVGQRFFSEIHLTDWRPFNREHPLFIGRYTRRSPPVMNTVKYMFRPQFVPPASCNAHGCLVFNGKSMEVAPKNQIAVHHFRNCETDRNFFRNGTFCKNTKKSPSQKIAHLADALTGKVLDTLRKLYLK